MATSQAANSTGTVQTPRPGMGGRTLVLFFALAFGLAWGP